jgi:restriction endonuclease
MARDTVATEDAALAELGSQRSRPPWMEGAAALPFAGLTPDEFEVLCFLLLRRENQASEVLYYGKTGDAGRDVVVRANNAAPAFYQCKHYSGTVGIGEVRAELAKLFCNVHSGVLLEKPDTLTFLVTTDLSAPAQDLLDNQDRWKNVARDALESHLGQKADDKLLEFATTWWPRFPRTNGAELSDRLRQFPELIKQFFSYKKVVEGSLEQLTPTLASIQEGIARLQVQFDDAHRSAPPQTADILRRMESANTGLSFKAVVQASGETMFTVAPRPGTNVEVGKLRFPPGEKGDAGREKLRQLEDFGRPARLEPGEFEWVSSLKGVPPERDDATTRVLELHPSLPREPIAVEISSGEGADAVTIIRFTRARVLRLGRREMEIQLRGGDLAGEINLVLGFQGNPNRVTYTRDLSSGPARAARATLDLQLHIAEQRRITIGSIDFAAPLISFDLGPDLAEELEWLRNSRELCHRLEGLAARFNVDLRYPSGDVAPDFARDVELAHAAIEVGRVSERAPGNIATFDVPKSQAEGLLALWEQKCPATIECPYSLPLQVDGVTLPIGDRRLVLEDAQPIGGLDALREMIRSTETPTLSVAMSLSRLIHEFPAFIKP